MSTPQAPGTHTDPIELMMEMLSRINAGDGKYDSEDQSLFYLIATLIAKMEGLSSEVAGIGDESNAFSTVLKDTQNVDRDITRIQKWYADHPTYGPDKHKTTMADAMTDKEFMADVAAFSKDMTQMRGDAEKYAFIHKYNKDGMNEGADTSRMIWDDTSINPYGSGPYTSIGDLITNGDMNNLAAVLFTGASQSTDTGGPFYKWQNDTGGGAGGTSSLKQVEQDFGMFVSNFNQTLNVDGTYLQQIQQTGQNDISSLNSMMNMIIQNLRAG